ncbi:hypothetical protein NUU61_001311 [Penicillium alfredii]|uniref:F-box domain-containing protein n=1 Tax=Penicillium alfredii TaxID=1506179 RepID=A0A9W9G462_9EURO|nr:uncharacterized protein NUU61_001311 [Penicillium alfredii]KAJ5111681.1 hypothetical protein NUU61_001311 [Penicillium alfredii]
MGAHPAQKRPKSWIDMPQEIKQMILCLLDPFTLSVLLAAMPDIRPLADRFKRTRNFKTLPIMAELLASAQPVPNPSIRPFHKPFEDFVSCGDGRYLSFKSDGRSHIWYWDFKRFPHTQPWKAEEWKSEPESIGVAGTMSVTVWPRRRGRTAFFNVPELLNPRIFDCGRLCLGYEKPEPGPWRLVVRQVSDWDLVAEQSTPDSSEHAYVLDGDSDLVVQYSPTHGSIRIWNPRRKRLWEVQHSNATRFNWPCILHGQKGFITTSKPDAYDDLHIMSWRNIVWQDSAEPSYMEQRDFGLSLSYLFPKNLVNGQSIGNSYLGCTQIHEICRNGILFSRPFDSPLAVTYMGKMMEFDSLERGFLDEFSDGTYVLRTDDLQMMKDDEQIWRLEDGRQCCGAMIYRDAFLIVVHCDNYRTLPSKVIFLNINGDLVYEFQLSWKYGGDEIRLLEEEGKVIILADDLSEATVWRFF